MKCHICRSADTYSVNNNEIDRGQIKYVAHSGFGTAIMGCRNCRFISAEFIHPKTLQFFYTTSSQLHSSALTDPFCSPHQDICRQQTEFFCDNLPKHNNRILFFGAGRSSLAQPYHGICDELFICDLVPNFDQYEETNISATVVDEAFLKDESLVGTFDTIILSNVVQRLPFPKSILSLCSRLLKSDGLLAFEVPITPQENVQAGLFGSEEINFFSVESLKALIIIQGSFDVEVINADERPKADPSSVGMDGTNNHQRVFAQIILSNKRPLREIPPTEIDSDDIGSLMSKLSFGCFLHKNSLMSWSDGQDVRRLSTDENVIDDH